MLIAWFAASLRMALETMLRFGVRPPVTIFERRPGQFPDIALLRGDLARNPEGEADDRPPAEPFTVRARRPASGRTLKLFHAARHAED